MSELTPAEARSRLAAEFDNRGWEYDLTAGRAVLEAAEAGESDSAALAERIPATFLAKNRADRADVVRAIERALGGRGVKAEEQPATVVINDHSYKVDIGSGAQISGSNINIGPGTQVNIDASADRDEVLAGVAAIVRAGLTGDWNDDAARALAQAVGARDDIATDDIREITAAVAEDAQPSRGRAREMLDKVTASGLGGALATGISAGLGQVIAHLPL
jgi:hypothetical protein